MEVRTLSRAEAQAVLALEAENREELTLEDLQRYTGASRGFARKLAHELVRKGWLERVGRGRYLLNPSRHGPEAIPDTDPFRIGSRLVRPYFFGYASAAELWGLLPQAGRVYYLATPSLRRPPRRLADRFRFVHVDRSRFFGFRPLVRRGQRLIVSDSERTILDALDRPELAGGMGGVVQILASAKPSLRWRRFESYSRRIGNRSLARRAGYLFDRVRRDVPMPPETRRALSRRAGEPFAPLGPPAVFGRRGRHDPRWGVIENVSEGQLFAEVDVR